MVRVRVQIHQHDTQGQRKNAESVDLPLSSYQSSFGLELGVRVQIHQHDTEGQRTRADLEIALLSLCRHLYLFPDLPCFKLGLG